MAASEPVLQLKVSLVGVSDPPVWRRLLVPASMRLGRLHDVIQAAMGWEDYHLHAFTANDVDYGPPDPELGHRNERRVALGDVISERGDRMRYVYDFGDHWRHDVVVEKVLTAEAGARYPICLTGKGRCPPEDCGGVWGYAELRETLADRPTKTTPTCSSGSGSRPRRSSIRLGSTPTTSTPFSAGESAWPDVHRQEARQRATSARRPHGVVVHAVAAEP
jgi:hypothetical protein